MPPQLRSARLYTAQQRSAVQCDAVPCPSFCGAVSCGAVRSFEHTAVVRGMIHHHVRVVYSSFSFFSCDCPLSIPMFPRPRKYHRYCRSERGINKHTAQRRAISSAQAPQLSIRTKRSRASPSCPFIYMFQLHSSLRERSGRRHFCPLRDFFFANFTRSTADQNVKSPTNSTAQAGQSAPHKYLLHYQTASCTKSWASYFCPLHTQLKSSTLGERSGRRQPPAGRREPL